MLRRFVTMTAVCAFVFAVPVLAQDDAAPGDLARITFWTAAGDGFEAGLAAHNDFHAEAGDPTAHLTWQIVTGKRAGTYIRGSFGHHWADFDGDPEFLAADEADSAETLDPHIASANPQIWRQLDAVSRPGSSSGPSAMAQVRYFHLRPFQQAGFMRTAAAIAAAADKTAWSGSWIWYELVEGGSIPTYILILPSDDWAGMAEPSPSFAEMLMQAEGEEGLARIMGVLADTVEKEWSETVVLRDDLTYYPSSDGM